jgi:general secretion pathway protein L
MAQRIVGLDLGSYSIKVVHVQARGRGSEFEVVAFDEEPVPPPFENEDGQVAPLAERQQVALKELSGRGMLKGDVVVTGLPGDAAAVRTLRFPFADARKIQQTLPFELESEIPFDIDDVVVSWAVLGRALAVDTEGEHDVLVAYARRELVVEHLAMLQEVGVDPRHVEFDALALDDLYDGVFGAELAEPTGSIATPSGTVIETGPGAPASAVAMVDIGHKRTSVCILAEGRVVSAQTILHGGGDATRQLARELDLAPDEAERGKKKEAFIEVTGAVAQFPEQARVSDILKSAYAPIARRLRQSFQAAVTSCRVRVTKVVLTGGGSRILNLDRHLAEVLNVRVARAPEIAQLLGSALPLPAGVEVSLAHPEAPQASLALGYALSGLYGDKTRSRLDFRTGEFAWKGELDFLRERTVPLAAWAAVLLLALLVGGMARAFVLSSEEDDIKKRQVAACRSITGQDIDSASRCLAIIQERISGQAGFTLPDLSAVDHYLTVARRLPPPGTLERKVTELDLNDERVRLTAVVASFDEVDKVVDGLKGGRCFESVEKGKARNVSSGVEFSALVRIDCAVAPGDGKEAEGEDQVSAPAAVPSSSGAARRPTPSGPGKAKRGESGASTAASGAPKPAARGTATLDADVPKARAERAAGAEDVESTRADRVRRMREKREELQRAREAAGGAVRPTPSIMGEGMRRPLPEGIGARTIERRGLTGDDEGLEPLGPVKGGE